MVPQVQLIVLFRFLGELKTPKRHFEINWPLVYNKKLKNIVLKVFLSIADIYCLKKPRVASKKPEFVAKQFVQNGNTPWHGMIFPWMPFGTDLLN